MAEKNGTVVLIDLFELPAVGREQQEYSRIPCPHPGVATVKDDDAVNWLHAAQVDLPPGLVLVLRMKSPFAVDDPIYSTSSVRFAGHFRSWNPFGDRPAPAAHLILVQPIGFDQLSRDGRCPGTCGEPVRQSQKQQRGETFNDHHRQNAPRFRSCLLSYHWLEAPFVSA